MFTMNTQLCGLCFLFWAGSLLNINYYVSSSDYNMFNISDRIYCHSLQTSFTFDDAVNNCLKIGAALAFFDDNAEYLTAFQKIIVNASQEKQTWITFNATAVNSNYVFYWKKQKFNNSVWASGQPDGECTSRSKKKCCARMRLKPRGLADMDCSNKFAYLCKAIPVCPAHALGCYLSCGETITNLTCLPGFQFYAANTSCVDVNECELNTSLCEGACQNTVGSYSCTCNTGYKLSGSYLCVDIDECSLGNHTCQQVCVNVIGSYNCSCSVGYMASDSGQCLDINECNIGAKPCQQTCTNTNGSFLCSCETGWTLSLNRLNCTQIDECASSPCQHDCVHTNTSFVCRCFPGYTLQSNGINCTDIDECKSSVCQHNCTNTDGSYLCTCLYGYNLQPDNTSCSDIDECLQNSSICSDICRNIPGGYLCGCPHGFYAINQNCSDVNECENTSKNNCSHHCNNTEGSYTCWCDDGYRLSENLTTCLDIDECEEYTYRCSDICINTIGSYRCACGPGYIPDADNITCLDVDECHNITCGHRCVNTIGSYVCQCDEGFILDTLNISACNDVDECLEASQSCNQTCDVAPDSNISACQVNVQDCKLCDHLCLNTNGSYLCTCQTGYGLNSTDNTTCYDIDECSLNSSLCEFYCNNTPGSYFCSCPQGYHLSENKHSCNKKGAYSQCPCRCYGRKEITNVTTQQLKEQLETLSKDIQVQEVNLLSTKLLLTCQPDDRPASNVIGYVGIVMLTFVFGSVVLLDLISFVSHMLLARGSHTDRL
ncbi:latent-transforming growth factor beta-binding protein 4-like [Biomphalaria glabrata]|uniref:Latent-transforming growth factor beta-binding protein 4-like n=1 Tax=Biomphalaria glabrata TaxID=6526 RepID=A0A9W2YLY5_BIOGL|nr:latent-transforming growth factor beta-binding protein 4-like [Biomphalaria glabrata]